MRLPACNHGFVVDHFLIYIATATQATTARIKVTRVHFMLYIDFLIDLTPRALAACTFHPIEKVKEAVCDKNKIK